MKRLLAYLFIVLGLGSVFSVSVKAEIKSILCHPENGYINAGTDGVAGTPDDNGRMFLGTSASTGETGLYFKQPGDPAAIQTPYAGDKIALNNFAFGNSVLGHFLSTETGGPNPLHPLFNPFYARFGAAGSASPMPNLIYQKSNRQ